MPTPVCPRLFLSILLLILVMQSAEAKALNKDSGSLKELLELMADRLELAEAVAKYKWEQRAAPDDDRLDPSTNDAPIFRSAGLDAKSIQAFHQAQVEAFKARQRQLFVRWKTAGTDGFDEVDDVIAIARARLEKNARDEMNKIAQLKEACATVSASQLNDMATPILRRRSLDKALFKPMLESLETLAREEGPGCRVSKAR